MLHASCFYTRYFSVCIHHEKGKETKKVEEDIERIKEVRNMIGKDVTFMVDANYSMTVEESISACKLFEPYNIFWFEEPTIPDNYKGYGILKVTIFVKI